MAILCKFAPRFQAVVKILMNSRQASSNDFGQLVLAFWSGSGDEIEDQKALTTSYPV